MAKCMICNKEAVQPIWVTPDGDAVCSEECHIKLNAEAKAVAEMSDEEFMSWISKEIAKPQRED